MRVMIASTFAVTQSTNDQQMTQNRNSCYKFPTGVVVTLIRNNQALALLHNTIPCPAFALTANTSQ